MTNAAPSIAVVSTTAATASRAAVPSIGAGTPNAPMGAGGVPEGMATGGDGYRAAPADTVMQALTAPVARVPGEPPEIVRLAQIQIEFEALDEQIRDAVAIHNADVPHMAEITRLRGLKNALLAEQAILVVRNNPVNIITPQDLMTAAERAETVLAAQQDAATALALRPITMTERIAAAFHAAGADMARYPMRHAFHLAASAELTLAIESTYQMFEARWGRGPIPELTAMSGVAALIGGAVYLGREAFYYLRMAEEQRHVHRVGKKVEWEKFLATCSLAAGSFAMVGGLPITNTIVGLFLGVGIFAAQRTAYALWAEGDNKKTVREASDALREKKEQLIREDWATEIQRIQNLDAETLMKEAAAALCDWLRCHYHTVSLNSPSGKLSNKALDIELSAEVSNEALAVARKFLNEDPLMQRLRELGAPWPPRSFAGIIQARQIMSAS